MQADQNAAQIYARAVFNVARERGILEAFDADVRALADLLASDAGRRLQRFWESPAILTEEKRALVQKALGSRVSPLLSNLVRMLIDKLRIENLSAILAELKRMADEERGLKPGKVITATPLDEEQKKNLRVALEKRVGGGLALDYEVKPQILGGVIFQYEDKLFDDSVRSRLAELRSKLRRASSAGAGAA
jgi:F-type H+-transporting ATPase subunit delta